MLLRGVDTLSKCSHEYVIFYNHHWIEDNNLYIQMELCSENLKTILDKKRQIFKRKPSEAMTSVEYFISCQLFRELLECVQYLHESNPPIIHRDLKPENVLIVRNPQNARFLKLCDFDLAKFTSSNTVIQTRGQGTGRYMAPEVNSPASRYSIKADVYSVGIIAQDIFASDMSKYVLQHYW